jgi:hypothetical protein
MRISPLKAVVASKRWLERDIGEPAQQREDKKYESHSQADDGAQQPAQVVAGSTQYRVQRIAGLPFEPATPHTVVVLHMSDDRFDRLPSFEPTPLRAGQGLVFAAMNKLY